ncbi:zincin-like metallopeptidase domain-containing protein [Sphingomonas pseudosanguinis]|uniref:zincin-like metallopeptidase domain-containing protein n=1 Tax=Sphingomonas pseudosanguinis TaxID=413712 RepID=UPI0016105C29|nr:zincin-like metallopeptidase domain-containing protein [Sphingomonas pseudosanguinis]MBN3535812.1 hypothetical protein [Sphingomonas pseudosanguinis]
MGDRARGPAPSVPLARGLQAQTCSSSCSYRLHLLRSWSLRQTRGGSHAAYLASWLQALRNDKRCIFTAATQAQAAADWLLSRMAIETAPELEEAA